MCLIRAVGMGSIRLTSLCGMCRLIPLPHPSPPAAACRSAHPPSHYLSDSHSRTGHYLGQNHPNKRHHHRLSDATLRMHYSQTTLHSWCQGRMYTQNYSPMQNHPGYQTSRYC